MSASLRRRGLRLRDDGREKEWPGRTAGASDVLGGDLGAHAPAWGVAGGLNASLDLASSFRRWGAGSGVRVFLVLG